MMRTIDLKKLLLRLHKHISMYVVQHVVDILKKASRKEWKGLKAEENAELSENCVDTTLRCFMFKSFSFGR